VEPALSKHVCEPQQHRKLLQATLVEGVDRILGGSAHPRINGEPISALPEAA
jgi:hypothetical protein